MSERYAFFYLMKNRAEKIQAVLPKHIQYWIDNEPANYRGGPFSDRSGGLILFEADDEDTAQTLAMNDPFVTGDVVAAQWVKRWLPQ